ncbi:MAG: ATP-binding protein [Microcoleus sp. SU_5_3]|nr:ATP-binding protein [Microcoleus sp. SU_5_3]
MNLNSLSNSHPDKDYSMDESLSDGIGIKIISQIADELSYTRTADRNCLFVVKYFPLQHNTQTGYFKRAIDILNSFNWLQEQKNCQFDRDLDRPLRKISLILNSEIQAVTQIVQWFDRCEDLQLFPKQFVQQCKIAAIEGFANVVGHAHKNLPLETEIELRLSVFKNRLELEIWDRGQPLDFQAKLTEKLPGKSLFSWNELEFTFY